MFWFVPTVRNVLSFDFVSLYVPRFGFQTMHLFLSCFSLTASVPLPGAERLALLAFPGFSRTFHACTHSPPECIPRVATDSMLVPRARSMPAVAFHLQGSRGGRRMLSSHTICPLMRQHMFRVHPPPVELLWILDATRLNLTSATLRTGLG